MMEMGAGCAGGAALGDAATGAAGMGAAVARGAARVVRSKARRARGMA
jgi:hypothetical protein